MIFGEKRKELFFWKKTFFLCITAHRALIVYVIHSMCFLFCFLDGMVAENHVFKSAIYFMSQNSVELQKTGNFTTS